jgi:hypothetical protein
VFPGGLLDLATFKKPEAWWRQALWSDQPMVYLAASQRPRGDRPGSRRFRGEGGRGLEEHWNWTAGSRVRVACCTNCPVVDLYRNGELVDTLTSEVERQGWRRVELEFQPGTLEAVGRDGERELCRFALRTAGPPRRVLLQSDVPGLAADGHDVAHLIFLIVDENGVRVPDSQHEVELTVEGPASILGMDNGRIDGAVVYHDNRCEAYRGRGLAIVRAQRQPGEATITALADDLGPARIVLHVK